jgi:hypothetical protein
LLASAYLVLRIRRRNTNPAAVTMKEERMRVRKCSWPSAMEIMSIMNPKQKCRIAAIPNAIFTVPHPSQEEQLPA